MSGVRSLRSLTALLAVMATVLVGTAPANAVPSQERLGFDLDRATIPELQRRMAMH